MLTVSDSCDGENKETTTRGRRVFFEIPARRFDAIRRLNILHNFWMCLALPLDPLAEGARVARFPRFFRKLQRSCEDTYNVECAWM